MILSRDNELLWTPLLGEVSLAVEVEVEGQYKAVYLNTQEPTGCML